jgi:hypothetical protein
MFRIVLRNGYLRVSLTASYMSHVETPVHVCPVNTTQVCAADSRVSFLILVPLRCCCRPRGWR